jgi:hypothetical protein
MLDQAPQSSATGLCERRHEVQLLGRVHARHRLVRQHEQRTGRQRYRDLQQTLLVIVQHRTHASISTRTLSFSMSFTAVATASKGLDLLFLDDQLDLAAEP